MDLNKPDTLRSTRIKEWIRIQFLSPYLRNIPKNDKTLDLACGWGFSFKINPGFYGIEYDEACVAHLKSKHNVTKGNLLEKLPFEDEFFDNCFSHDVLEHFEFQETEAIFKNVHRILKKGGKFINIVPNKLGYDFGLKINAGHKHYITPDEIKQIAERNGYTFESAHASPLPELFNKISVHNKWVVTCRRK